MSSEPSLAEQLARLRAEHRDLDQAISALTAQSGAGDLAVERLKKRRLVLADQIERLRQIAMQPNEADLAATPTQRMIAHLRTLAHSDLSALTGEQTNVIGQIKTFIEWLDNPRPECTDGAPSRPDKFAGLIELSRRYQDCNRYYLSEVSVNASTVWRWASGNSRPSRFVGVRIVAEVKVLIVQNLWRLSTEVGLVDVPIGDQFVPPVLA